MKHRRKNKILDRQKAPREAMLRNLAASLLIYEKVKTTSAKAKALRPVVEKLITAAKANNLTARRRLIKYLPLESAVRKTLEVLVPRYKERAGGYTRVVKIGQRRGDGAPIVQIELVK